MKRIKPGKNQTPQNKPTLFYTAVDSPIGKLLIASSEKGLVRIIFPNEGESDPTSQLLKDFPEEILIENRNKNQKALDQLQEYFEGSRTDFTLPLAPRGTKFQKSVWKAVSRTPYGQTRSYGEIARSIGNPKACRAVGNANRTNPIPIIIPCHRIIGSDGSMTGYGGGIPLKEKLLQQEKTA